MAENKLTKLLTEGCAGANIFSKAGAISSKRERKYNTQQQLSFEESSVYSASRSRAVPSTTKSFGATRACN